MDNVFSALPSPGEIAWSILKEMWDRMEKIEFSHEARKRVMENIQFIQSMLEKIKHHVRSGDDMKHMEQFCLHLKNAKESCDQIGKIGEVLKFFKAPEIVVQLNDIDNQLKIARQKLGLFMDTLHITIADEMNHCLQKDMKKLQILQENPDCGIYYSVDNSLKLLPPPTLSVTENTSKSRFLLSWKPYDVKVDEYEICYDECEGRSKKIKGGRTHIEIGAPLVEPGRPYTIKIRGIREGIKGKWSNSVVGQFVKPVPSRPDPPKVIITGPTTANITVTAPQQKRDSESVVIKWKIEYVTDFGTEWFSKFYEVESSKSTHSLHLSTLEPERLYYFRVSAKNTEGWSEPSKMASKNTKNVKPSQPTEFRISSKRTHSLIKIRWKPPQHNAKFVGKYEVRTRSKKIGYGEPIEVPAGKLSYTFTNLKQRTDYFFQVRACNGNQISEWNEEITATTRIHKAFKALVSPAVWVAATAGSPVLTTMGLGAAAGIAANESSGKVAAVAAGTAGTVGGAAIGTIAAPFIGAGMTHMFVHGIDELSDQSDDES